MAAWKPEVIEDGDPPPNKADIDEVLLRLKLLGQRFVIALSDLFSLITATTVFVLALLIVPYQPSSYQLSGLAGYALFVLAINFIVRRR